jgi:hypothetical protein
MSAVVRATRTHYAMLQHRQSPDRVPLAYEVLGVGGHHIQSACLWVKAGTEGRRKAALTRVTNVLLAMFPEARTVTCEFPKA